MAPFFPEGEASVLYMTFVFPPGHLKCRLFVFKYTRISRSLISDFVTVNLERRREKKRREEERREKREERREREKREKKGAAQGLMSDS